MDELEEKIKQLIKDNLKVLVKARHETSGYLEIKTEIYFGNDLVDKDETGVNIDLR